MRRREVYATSGPRIAVRTYGGLNLSPTTLETPGFPTALRTQAVPMGGEIMGLARAIASVGD